MVTRNGSQSRSLTVVPDVEPVQQPSIDVSGKAFIRVELQELTPIVQVDW